MSANPSATAHNAATSFNTLSLDAGASRKLECVEFDRGVRYRRVDDEGVEGKPQAHRKDGGTPVCNRLPDIIRFMPKTASTAKQRCNQQCRQQPSDCSQETRRNSVGETGCVVFACTGAAHTHMTSLASMLHDVVQKLRKTIGVELSEQCTEHSSEKGKTGACGRVQDYQM